MTSKISRELEKFLDEDRLRHSLAVEKVALKLAKIHRANVKKAALAGLLHDCAKWMSGSELLRTARNFRIKIDPFMRVQPKLLHAPVSACFAKKYFGIKDKEILQAIQSHTTGRPNMTVLEKIIYLADHIEPGRRYRHVETIRRLAMKDLDAAIAHASTEMIKYLLNKGLPVYSQTVQTRNHYLKHRRDKQARNK